MENQHNKVDAVKRDFIDRTVLTKLESYDHGSSVSNGKIPIDGPYTLEGQQARLNFIREHLNATTDYISGKKVFDENSSLKGNIENYIGMTQIPTGIIGPLVINGMAASGSFYIPMATTEGTLLASYSRGAKACKESGPITTLCLQEGVQRCPFFKFKNLIDLGKFVSWILENREVFVQITHNTSNYAKLYDLGIDINGNELIIRFEYTTGDASGQNMVTICTNQICDYIIKNSPIKPVHWCIESNVSGDKKATTLALTRVRGKKITAEVALKRDVVVNILKTTPELIVRNATITTISSIKSGALSTGMHPANALAALFLACGQDVACVSEACTAITRMELTDNGDLYCSITMPNLIVGTVGGGTSFPTQREALSLIDCYGPGKSTKLAEEISIISAVSAGQFASAHQRLGRK